MMAKLMGVVERLQQELFRADASRLAAERCATCPPAPGQHVVLVTLLHHADRLISKRGRHCWQC
jgi:hypothetical protein